MRDWVQAVSRDDSKPVASSLEGSIKSHFLAIKTGESMESYRKYVDVKLPREVIEAVLLVN